MDLQGLQDTRENLALGQKERKVFLGSQDPGVSLVPMDLQVFQDSRENKERLENLGCSDFLVQRGILEIAGTQDRRAFWQLHLRHSKVLQGTQGPQAATEKLEMLDYWVHWGPQADQGKLVQAWWDLLGHQGFLVLQDFQGKLVFLEDSTVLQENQGSQDHLACLEHQDHQASLDQM